MTSRNPSHALGAIVYDLHLLATAILAHRERRSPSRPELKPVFHQRIAAEVMLIKSRTLLDLISPKGKQWSDDITMEQLGLAVLKELDNPLATFREYASKRSAHLTWQRAEPELRLWETISDEQLQERAAIVLEFAYNQVVRPLLARNVVPTLDRHVSKDYLGVLHTQMRSLGLASTLHASP